MIDSNARWFKSSSRSYGSPKARLLCLPYAGGSAATFNRLSAFLPPWLEVLSVQYPGREDRFGEPPVRDLRTLAAAIARQVAELEPLDYAVFGYSYGALLAFEMALELRRRKSAMPQALFVAAAGGPRINLQRHDPRDRWPDARFVEELRGLGGTADEVLDNPELMRLVLPALRADLGAVDHYHFEGSEPLDMPIHAIGGLDDSKVAKAALDRWHEHTTDAVSIQMIAGDHFFLHDSAALLADVIVDRWEPGLAASGCDASMRAPFLSKRASPHYDRAPHRPAQPTNLEGADR